MPVIRLETPITAPPAACFRLSLSVDAHTGSMRRSGERAVAGVRHGQLGLGDVVTWRARHFGLPFRMTVAITAYDDPVRFVDEQQSGPFASWWHEHTFEAAPGGATLMRDHVEFRSPAGPIGGLVDRHVLSGYLTRLLVQRNRYLHSCLARPDH